MAGTAYLTRMPLGFVGAVTRPRDLTIEPVTLDHTNLFSTYGLPGKYVNDQFVPLVDGDTIAKVKGILFDRSRSPLLPTWLISVSRLIRLVTT